jgi:hypothetical protein
MGVDKRKPNCTPGADWRAGLHANTDWLAGRQANLLQGRRPARNGATDTRQVLVSYRIVFILGLIPVSVFFLLVRKSIVSYLDLRMEKKKNSSSFFFVFSSIRPDILCIK